MIATTASDRSFFGRSLPPFIRRDARYLPHYATLQNANPGCILITACLFDYNQRIGQCPISDMWQPSTGSLLGRGLSSSLGVFGGKCTSLKMLLTVAEFIALQRTTPSPSLLLILNPPFEVWLQVQDLPLLLELSLSRA